jgi:MoaA/NifB/PqqE/SkfB family radical SAM enzyme
LASGKLPIPNCCFCVELRIADKATALKHVNEYHLPKGIMVENTSKCNLKCLSCNRQNVYTNRATGSLSLEDIKYISSEVIKAHGMKTLAFFNLGEPFLHKDIKRQLEILRNDNPQLVIATSTNGLPIDNDEMRDAALYLDRIVISIDGSTNEEVIKYQQKGSFEKAYRNMKALVEYRNSRGLKKPAIEWKYVLFRWNDSRRSIKNAIELAKEAGVDKIFFWQTWSPVYGISFKYYLSNFVGHNYLGDLTEPRWWHGREVILNKEVY